MAAMRDDEGHEPTGAARRAWLAGLLVWTLLLQLLVPALGPLRLGDGTATAGLGRIVPICTIQGLRVPEPAPAGDAEKRQAAQDFGWHCALCVTPALPATSADASSVPIAWRIAWAIPLPRPVLAERPWSPLSARGPPHRS